MEKGSQKTQAYPWICRGFLRTLDSQEIGADRNKNRSVQVKMYIRLDRYLSRTTLGFIVDFALSISLIQG
ncbi:MAG: hypothetical protein DRH90_17830 [Deltaproteobacteria bacterium]|nr:MAG: hypothetical protein DRH90_17830 [Deltaproteobacteria bacterium]